MLMHRTYLDKYILVIKPLASIRNYKKVINIKPNHSLKLRDPTLPSALVHKLGFRFLSLLQSYHKQTKYTMHSPRTFER